MVTKKSKTPNLTLRLPNDLKDKFNKYCKLMNISKTDFMVWVLSELNTLTLDKIKEDHIEKIIIENTEIEIQLNNYLDVFNKESKTFHMGSITAHSREPPFKTFHQENNPYDRHAGLEIVKLNGKVYFVYMEYNKEDENLKTKENLFNLFKYKIITKNKALELANSNGTDNLVKNIEKEVYRTDNSIVDAYKRQIKLLSDENKQLKENNEILNLYRGGSGIVNTKNPLYKELEEFKKKYKIINK
jgi:hypothetical protein